ncbi:MAG: PD40 domain-containing protein [Actinobacteria bacterium]|nr:PD40 domain-containing protein [Actinomycetota bacterium]
MKARHVIVIILTILACVTVVSMMSTGYATNTEHKAIVRISTDSAGNQSSSEPSGRTSTIPSISTGGRYVAFDSLASDLVPGNRGGTVDVFIKDTETGAITSASTDSAGNDGYDDSYDPSISSDGRYVAFSSDAANLVYGDTNNRTDIFVKDTQTGITTRVSTDSSGRQATSNSYSPAISSDGSRVVFASDAGNLISSDTNVFGDVFMKNIFSGTTVVLTSDSSGNQYSDWSIPDLFNPSISSDGRYVAFCSSAPLAGGVGGTYQVFVKDTLTGSTIKASSSGNFTSASDPSISADARYIAFRAQTVWGGISHIYVRDMATGTTQLASISQAGVWGNGSSFNPSISADGSMLTFESDANNLVLADSNNWTDVFVKELPNGLISRVSVDTFGRQANFSSEHPCIAGDGRHVVFLSFASNLVQLDTNNARDHFLANTIQLPAATNVSPTGWINGADTLFEANLANNSSGLDLSSLQVMLDGVGLTGCSIIDSNFSCAVSSLAEGQHTADAAYCTNDDTCGHINSSFGVDLTNPAITNASPAGWTKNNPSITANLSDAQSGIDSAKTNIYMDGSDLPLKSCTRSASNISCLGSVLAEGHHTLLIEAFDIAGNTSTSTGAFDMDITAPIISNVQPQSDQTSNAFEISADFADTASGIDETTIHLYIDGEDVTSQSTITEGHIGLSVNRDGTHYAHLIVGDRAQNSSNEYWMTTAPAHYYFPWYDSQAGKTWVMMAQPSSGSPAARDNTFDIFLRNLDTRLMEEMNADGPVPVDKGRTNYVYKAGAMGGPVMAVTDHGDGLVSERSLFGNSFEEVWGTSYEELDSHYWWPVYDAATPGMQNWILVANPPESGEDVTVRVRIYRTTINETKTLAPGESWTPSYPGVQAGPVEVKGWIKNGSESSAADARKVIASQRVLYKGAFNEMPGIAASSIDNSYMWTWYDNVGGSNWIVISNPNPFPVQAVVAAGNPEDPIFVDVQQIGAYSSHAFQEPGGIGGPVYAFGYKYTSSTQPDADIIASQRVLWGPSFGELSGTAFSDLQYTTANWTWYDQVAPGVANWVMIANPTNTEIYAEVRIAGETVWGETIAPFDRKTPSFAGKIGGPVQVESWISDIDTVTGKQRKADPYLAFASQRVLWNGYFNEVVGKGL